VIELVAVSVTVDVLDEERVYPIVAPIANARTIIVATRAMSRDSINLVHNDGLAVLFEPTRHTHCSSNQNRIV
jgi:hypothetical protein